MTQNTEPLTPAVLHILLALSQEALHGYAIMQRVDELSKGQIPMGPGTLYGSIKRMLAVDFIQEVDAPDDEADSRRKYYALTTSGRNALTDELARLSSIVAYARANNLIEDSGS